MWEKCFTGDEFTVLIGNVGPIEAARQLIERLDRRITAINVRCLRFKGCTDAIDHARDVTQMQYLATINELIRFHNGQKKTKESYTNPAGYVLKIGENLCDQHIRTCRYGEIVGIVSEDKEVDHSALVKASQISLDRFWNNPVERELYMKEQEQLLHEAFCSLMPRRREAVRLKLEGLTAREIARRMGLKSDENARQLVRRGINDIYTFVCKKIGEKL